MARPITAIGEVDKTMQTWRLAIRITDLWLKRSQNAANIEMILMDQKGDKIYAIATFAIDKWKDILKEGKSYIAQNFEVQTNDGEFRKSKHPFNLIFTKRTSFKEQEIPAIPDNIYHFTDFADILSGKASPDYLVDIIGEFVQKLVCQTDVAKKKFVCILRDHSGKELKVTLWGEYAHKMKTFLDQYETGPIVVLLTFGKIKLATDNYPLTVQNSYYHSKLYINDDKINEILNFTNSLNSNIPCVSFSQKMRQLSSSSQVQSGDWSLLNAQLKSIKQINSLFQESYCSTVGKIEMIYVNNGWYYDGCPSCKKKADDNGPPFVCKWCKETITETIPRFKIEMKVSHAGEETRFILWDEDSMKLLNTTALELRNQLIQDGETDENAFPVKIDSLTGKIFAFKVRVQPDYKKSSVVEVSNNLEIIGTILKKIEDNEDIILHENTSQPISSASKEEVFDTQSLSRTADFGPDLLDSVTPAKRTAQESLIDASQEQNSCQLSSTKLAKHIKTEWSSLFSVMFMSIYDVLNQC